MAISLRVPYTHEPLRRLATKVHEKYGLKLYLEDVVLGEGKPIWKNLFDGLGDYFDKWLGSGWKEKDTFFKKLEEQLRQD